MKSKTLISQIFEQWISEYRMISVGSVYLSRDRRELPRLRSEIALWP